MTQPRDPIDEAFENLRRQALARTGKVPDLSRQGARRAQGPKRRGIPTGLDGRARRRPNDIPAVGELLQGEIRRRGWKKDLAGGWIFGHWEQLVGEKIAQHTTVQMLKEKKLFISCDSTAWATNLRMMQRQILQEIAKQVGPDVVAELKIFGPNVPSWRKGPLHVKGRGPRDTYG